MQKHILFCLFLIFSVSFTPVAIAKEISLQQKIGQMIMIGFIGAELHPDDVVVKSIQDQSIGGVVLYADDNIHNPKDLKFLTKQLQDDAEKAAKVHGNNLYPLLIGVDYEGGPQINPLKQKFGFPKTLSAAEIGRGSVQQAEKYARQMAHTLQQEGINLNFSPVVDLNINPRNPIIGRYNRSFGKNPQQVIRYANIFASAYKQAGILCVYKHFPGHGSSKGDTHKGFVDVTKTWKAEELNLYKQLILSKNACPLIMTAHVVNHRLDAKGYPASLSHTITTNLLRNQFHFQGTIITDDLQMRAILDHYGLKEAIILAVNSGADILILAGPFTHETISPEKIVEVIYDAVQAGKISEKRIDEAYQHIMRLKKLLIKK